MILLCQSGLWIAFRVVLFQIIRIFTISMRPDHPVQRRGRCCPWIGAGGGAARVPAARGPGECGMFGAAREARVHPAGLAGKCAHKSGPPKGTPLRQSPKTTPNLGEKVWKKRQNRIKRRVGCGSNKGRLPLNSNRKH